MRKLLAVVIAFVACVGGSRWYFVLRAKTAPESLLVQHLGGSSERLGVEIRSFAIHGTYGGRNASFLLRMTQPAAIEVWAFKHGFEESEGVFKNVALTIIDELNKDDEVRRILAGSPNVRYLVNNEHKSGIWLVWANNGIDAVLFIQNI